MAPNAPDRHCVTRADGECVSDAACMHGPSADVRWLREQEREAREKAARSLAKASASDPVWWRERAQRYADEFTADADRYQRIAEDAARLDWLERDGNLPLLAMIGGGHPTLRADIDAARFVHTGGRAQGGL